MTTRELIKKDFAMEPDETKMRQAAHLMVSNLSGSLALVTCREPLRQSMVQHLRTLLSASGKYSSEGAAREWSTVVIVIVIFISRFLFECLL